jgi:hypothetical protein
MNEYRFDGLDAVVDQDGKIIYDDVTSRTGDIIAGLLEDVESYDAECDRLAAKLGDVMAERDALLRRVAELEAQRWVPTGHMKTGMGHGVTLEFTPDRTVIVGIPAAFAVAYMPDDVRLCRLVSQVPTPPGADI